MTTPPTEEDMTSLLLERRISRPMELMTIVSAPETPPETPLFTLTNLNQVRAALSLSLGLYPLVNPAFGVEEVDLHPLIWLLAILAYTVFATNRFLGMFASHNRNELSRELFLTVISFFACLVVLGLACYFYLRSGNPAISEIVALCQITNITGMFSSNKALLNNFMPYVIKKDRK